MKEKISSIQLFSMFILSFISSSIGLSLYMTVKIASIDSYIGVLIGSFIGIIPFLIFLYIFNYKKDKTIFEKNTILFGKVFGNIINYILVILFFFVGAIILFNLSNFIVSQYLADTPLIYILILFGIILYHILNKGIETISRVSTIFCLIFLSFFVFGVIVLNKDVKLDNLKPILEFGLNKPLIAGCANSIITTIPFYTILVIPKNNIIDNKKTTKYLVIGYIISSFMLFMISFISTSILGKYLINLYQYPGYMTLKKVSIFEFIDRIENFLSLHWILSCFITITMILYYIKSNIKRNGNSKLLNIILCLSMIIFSYKAFKNSTVFNNYIYYVYPYVLLAIFTISVLTIINIFIRKIFKKKC